MVADVTAAEAWAALRQDPHARLIDVRTEAEWDTVGLPDLSVIGQAPIRLSWLFPGGVPNPAFVEGLRQAGAGETDRLFFLCRSGARSLAAANAAEAAGFTSTANIRHGFEAPGGWRDSALP